MVGPGASRIRWPGFALRFVIAALLYLASPAHSLDSQAPLRPEKPLSSVGDIQSLSPERAASGVTVRIKGVVSVLSGWKDSFFLQEETEGIAVNRADGGPELEPGDIVLVDGTTVPGGFAPSILSNHVQILGKTHLPPPRIYKPAELVGGVKDSDWVGMFGNIRSAEIKSVWERPTLMLTLDIGAGTIVEVHVRDFAPEAVNHLAGAIVTIQGVCGTVFNDRRQFIGLRLFVSSLKDIVVNRPPPFNPFAVPFRPLGGLLQFSDSINFVGQIKVRGTVIWSQPGSGFYLQDDTTGAFVESPETNELNVGTEVEVAGYPTMHNALPALRASAVRVLHAKVPLRALPRSAADMIVVQNGFITTPYDSRLVRLHGTVLQELPGTSVDVLILQDGNVVFSASMPNFRKLRHVEPGAIVNVTGVCAVNLDEIHEASSFQVRMRTPQDIVVVHNAPWWNARLALWLLGASSLLSLAIVAWAILSRRRAHLEALAVTDPLTSLYNRRGFILLARKQWELALRREEEMLLFYLDLNRFKEINDKFGHRQGDQALQLVAKALREAFREFDILARLGGDEFAVVATEASSTDKDRLLRQIDEAIERVNREAVRSFRISVSVGVIACDTDERDCTLEDLLERADSLMYERKRATYEEARGPAFS